MYRREYSNILILSCIALTILLVSGCGSRRKTPPPLPLPPAPAVKELEPLGYSIQAGAFSKISNAVRLYETLEKLGLEAYYFRHKSGLFKVRFGDFSSRDAAAAAAERYLSSGYIEVYYIVGPDDYALAGHRIYGTDSLRSEIVRTAESFIGLPYKWGGSSPRTGFDCSGLSMAVYRLNGLNLPRTSLEQYNSGQPKEREELYEGDLVFFKTTNGRDVSHVGIYSGEGNFIHAPGTGKDIRVDSLSNRYYASRYAGAKSYLR